MAQSSHIAVIGAGVMGLGAAFSLQRAGHRVTLYDPGGFPAQNASLMAGGMLAPLAESEHLPPAFSTAAQASLNFWRGITAVTENGSLLIAHDEDRYMLERFKTHLPPGGDAQQTVDHKTLAAMEPSLAARFTHALHLTTDAHLDPRAALNALCESLQQNGALFKTERADPRHLNADLVIDCRGYGAAEDDADLRGVKGETLLVRNPEFALSRPVRLMHPRYPLYIVPRGDGLFMIGATIIESADSAVSLRSGLELMSALYSLSPGFAEAQILEIRAGIRPAYPDNLPRITADGNIIRCNGLFRHGYLLAPAIAQVVADYTAGRENEFTHLFMRGPHDRHHQRSEKNIHRAA